MVIGTRILTIRGPVADIPGAGPARAPEDTDGHGICRFTIGRPEEPCESLGAGVDALRAIHLAMQRTGIDLKVSAAHETGTRVGKSPGMGRPSYSVERPSASDRRGQGLEERGHWAPCASGAKPPGTPRAPGARGRGSRRAPREACCL
ncbi:DUF6968 family protein [Methylobacterium fujisawaense]|uniref:DUF6968 family protein n=1 Tax=Methylobacterium fujisawaense TaxID=107400 RepID=UPI0036F70B53